MKKQVLTAVLAASVLIPSAGFAAPLAEVSTDASGVHFQPAAFGDYELRVSGPEGYSYRETSSAPTFAAFDGEGKALADGSYVWELVAVAGQPAEGDRGRVVVPQIQSGSFTVSGGSIVDPSLPESIEKAQIYVTDVITQGSNCTGIDCGSSESFGSDTLRLKENNLRIHFDDTSSTASFPSNDWRLQANDSGNGGANYFSIEDVTGGTSPFKIEAGARNNAIYAEADGDLGIGTANPELRLHIVHGNSPNFRLDQDGSQGFQSQSWDISGNETNFFFRDVNHSSNLPFRIRKGAPQNALFIDAAGNVGLNTEDPAQQLHIVNSDGDTQLLVDENSTTETARNLLSLENNGPALMRFKDTSMSQTWQDGVTSAGNYSIRETSAANDEFVLTTAGNLTVTGNITANTAGSSIPDYVFEADYELMPLDELAAFVTERKHLPNVPTAGTIGEQGLDMTQMQLRLLEKVEELTLYTIDQHEEIRDRSEKIRSRAQIIEQLEARLAALEG